MVTAEQVNHFWLEEVEPEAWFTDDAELDSVIIERFMVPRNRALAGELDDWQDTAEGALALVILLDQFSRNMFRGDGRSFEADAKARDIARAALAKDFDLTVGDRAGIFFFMPFRHSEDLKDHDFALSFQRARGTSEEDLLHGLAHRVIIEQFGRFPFRNKVLGRETTQAEQAFLDAGGYRVAVQEIQGDTGAD